MATTDRNKHMPHLPKGAFPFRTHPDHDPTSPEARAEAAARYAASQAEPEPIKNPTTVVVKGVVYAGGVGGERLCIGADRLSGEPIYFTRQRRYRVGERLVVERHEAEQRLIPHGIVERV